ncbi:enhanced level of genomic instability 1 [Lutzomyia longipalpis]|uniref:enhanced level of genomic instability 1 n=1 Tax=Lutzomyia longipalpis TaxID=7200 RepID=UPI0024840229|nr:enhanced level of genomic instability 1 [Lutzomyia longipalpis]
MNGIRQYFATVPKEEASRVVDIDEDEPQEIQPDVQDRKKSQKIVSNMESVIKSVRKKKLRKKRPKGSVSGDGDISAISNILSSSLNLISPKKTPRKRRETSPDVLKGNSPETEELPISLDQEVEDQENIVNGDNGQKKNVFEVMMQARGKISLTSTPNVGIPEKKRRFPEEFALEESTKKVKRAKRSLEELNEDSKLEEKRKKPPKLMKKKKLFELDVETVEFPRKNKSQEVDHNGTFESEREDKIVPEKKEKLPTGEKSRKVKKKRKKIVEVEAVVVFSSEPEGAEGVQEQRSSARVRRKKKRAIERDSSPEIVPNGKILSSRKHSQIVNMEEEVTEVDSPQRRPQRSCRQKVISYSVDMTFLNSSPEQPKSAKKSTREKKNDVVVVDGASPRRSVKLAPIFVKPVKLEIDPEALRAKQEFLMSGIPEKMRQTIERQKAIEEDFELELFPLISHITQLEGRALSREVTWRAKKIPLPLNDEYLIDETAQQHPQLRRVCLIDGNSRKTELIKPIPGNYLTQMQQLAILRDLKRSCEGFSSKKAFGFFRKRFESFREAALPVAKPKKTSRLLNSSVEIIEDVKDQAVLFTDKYRPESCDEFFINNSPAVQLKDFLESFQVDSSRLNGTFESFTGTDSSSCFSNSCCVVLSGPCGSGKSASVAAVAAQLNFNVLEVNAGIRRTGKRLLQELQEATQSHKVARGTQDNPSQKFSLILIEDAEIAFEQDDGFIGAINQIVADSKRPVILTTTEPNCSHLARFMAMNVIHFAPPHPEDVSKWFTLMVLAEGIHINEADVRDLYAFCGHDVRKTMMELEFFTRSGGDAAEAAQGAKYVHVELNKSVKAAGLRSASYDTLWSNTGQWLEEVGKGGKVEDFAEFYDVISTCEVLSCRLEEDEVTQCLLEGAVGKRGIPLDSYNPFIRPRDVQRSSLSSGASSRVAHLDYEPILRGICRSEQEKASRERKSSRFYHYLRQIVSDASNEVFERHCNIFS